MPESDMNPPHDDVLVTVLAEVGRKSLHQSANKGLMLSNVQRDLHHYRRQQQRAVVFSSCLLFALLTGWNFQASRLPLSDSHSPSLTMNTKSVDREHRGSSQSPLASRFGKLSDEVGHWEHVEVLMNYRQTLSNSLATIHL